MKEFTKRLEQEREPEPQPEEGKELSDEEKKQLLERRQQEQVLQYRELDRLMKEAPKYKFNTNVFKNCVTLDMSEQELKKEEDQVEHLAAYILDTTLPALIADLKQLEGIPTDSASLTEFFHKRGVNMRYLGKVIERLSEVPENTEKY